MTRQVYTCLKTSVLPTGTFKFEHFKFKFKFKFIFEFKFINYLMKFFPDQTFFV